MVSEHTRFVAKEVPLITEDNIKQFPMKHTTKFKNVQIGRYSEKKDIGLKISGNCDLILNFITMIMPL